VDPRATSSFPLPFPSISTHVGHADAADRRDQAPHKGRSAIRPNGASPVIAAHPSALRRGLAPHRQHR